MFLDAVLQALAAGLAALMDYLSGHVLSSIVPAFFLAGAISAFFKKDTVIKYLGPGANRATSYGIAALAGGVIAVCSCTVLPLFTSIYRRGAGIGPATTFLFSGPAINILAIILTASVLGLGLGIARGVAAITMSIVLGLLMSMIFERKRPDQRVSGGVTMIGRIDYARPRFVTPLLFVLLLGILLTASSSAIGLMFRIPAVLAMIVMALMLLAKYYGYDERRSFARETWWLFKKIFPLLLVGSFVSGVIGHLIPADTLSSLMGDNDPASCTLASGLGAVLYMPTLLEVPIVGTLFGYSTGVMAAGPALALLLSGPSISLPSMLVLWRTLAARKAIAYIILVVIVSAAMGILFGPYII